MKIFEALLWAEEELRSYGVDNARWDADCLLAHVLGCRREQLYLNREQALTEAQGLEYLGKVRRRSEREPLQYILGQQEFMGLVFEVDQRVLIPRPDSEVLVEKVLEFIRSAAVSEGKIRVADVCTGSGALAIAVAHYGPESSVVGTDISPEALAVAQTNSERLKVPVEWRQGDFLEPLKSESWDILISNPPYIAEAEYRELAPEIFREPEMAFLGGTDGLDFYRRLAREALALLKPEGSLFCEIGWQQGEAVQKIFQENGYDTWIFSDFGGRDRVVKARGRDEDTM